jgi:TPR repeat protein
MHEVPENMQQDLQRLELEAQSYEPKRDSMGPPLNTQGHSYGQQYQQPKAGQPPVTDYSPASNYSPFHESAGNDPEFEKKAMDIPSFSPFPKVSGEHIPPGDEEKAAVLAESRDYVLHSNDPGMQICWARDVLSYVEIAAEFAIQEAAASRALGDHDAGRPVTPKVEHELRVDALSIVNHLADQGHPEAVFIRSKWLEFGKFGRRQDKKEAYAGYMQAAQGGYGRAEYRIGMLFENMNDMENALSHYNKGLELKDSAASYRLGMINLLGQHGQRKDIARGLQLIHSAADAADEDAPQGAFVYGMIIARELPDVTIPEDILSYDGGVARQYIEKAAYLGFAKAQLKMGQAYELCQLGCDFNPTLSLHYYSLSAKQGQPEACLGISRWFLFGYESAFAKNEKLSYKYAQLAAKAQLATGEFAMGYYNEIGIFVDKNLREARRWYELAAEHGNKDAVGRIEGLAQAKSLSKQDHETVALGRIKSQHGSMRGKRPDRFKQNNPMPMLAEDRRSPRPSPHSSPRALPYDSAGSNMPDPTRPNAMLNTNRPNFPAKLAERPKSAAPYPVDEKPAPLNPARPLSAAPYPDEDPRRMRPPATSQFNNGAFGIRSSSPRRQGPPGPAMRPSQSAGVLGVPSVPPHGGDSGRGRPVSGPVASAYRQPSPGPGSQEYRHQSAQYPQASGYDQRLPGGPAQHNPAKNRLTKANPNPGLPQAQRVPPNQFPMGGNGAPSASPSQPGREYGPRTSSVPSMPGPGYSGRASAAPGASAPTMPGSFGPRTESMGGMSGGSGGPRVGAARPAPQMKDRPAQLQNGGQGRASAPPAQARPGPGSPHTPRISGPGAAASAGSPPAAKPSPPTSKPAKGGPATFEEMGIPQAKAEGDCVSFLPRGMYYLGGQSDSHIAGHHVNSINAYHLRTTQHHRQITA